MKKIVILGLGVVVGALLMISATAYYFWAGQPVNPAVTETDRFVIPKGQAVSVIADRLFESGYIRQPLLFRLELRRLQLADKIQAGSFELSPSMSMREIAQRLTSGTNDQWITIPEGWRTEEIAQNLSQQDLPAFNESEFLELAAASEGHLFPDTYLIPTESTAQTIYALLTDTFETKVVEGLADEFEASPNSFEKNVIMASLVEREARGYDQMRQVAGVLWHRIDLGMPLQVDATLQYARGYDQATDSWWSPPRAVDRQLDSPFNTYLNPGLPPQPISNPGLEAIRATLNPAQTDYLFYIHDQQGNIHFARTLDEHNANINRYLR